MLIFLVYVVPLMVISPDEEEGVDADFAEESTRRMSAGDMAGVELAELIRMSAGCEEGGCETGSGARLSSGVWSWARKSAADKS